MIQCFTCTLYLPLSGAITRMMHYSVVITLIQRMESFGISPDVYTLTVLINCYCHLNRVNFGFSVLATILKLGYLPTQTTPNTLLKGLRLQGNISWKWRTKGLCKIGQIGVAIRLFRKLEKGNFEQNVVLSF